MLFQDKEDSQVVTVETIEYPDAILESNTCILAAPLFYLTLSQTSPGFHVPAVQVF